MYAKFLSLIQKRIKFAMEYTLCSFPYKRGKMLIFRI